MKKLFIALLLFGSYISRAQTNTNLSSIIDPAKNRGYLKWNGTAAPQYRVNVYELQDTTMVLLSTQTTTNNYVQFQPLLFSLPNLHYQIIALNDLGNAISQGDVIPNNELCVGCTGGAEEICYNVCNGRTYAWKMTAYEDPNHSSTSYIKFSNAYQHYDWEEGYAVPYWQAFTPTNFANLSQNHPYKQDYTGTYGDGSPLYRKTEINPDLPSTYYDANNFSVSSGVLVEKRLDQFQLMNNSTSSFHPPLCQPSTTSMNWATFFNNNIDVSSTGMVSPYTNYFTNVDEATCSPSNGYSGGGITDTNAYNWGEILSDLDDFWGCIINYNILPSIYGCFDGSLSGFGGVVISSIEDDSFNVRFKNANPAESVGAYYVTSHTPETMPKIEKGLYNFTLYLRDGNAIPTVIEFDKTIENQPLKDFASLDLKPNPIKDNEINFEVTDSLDLQKAVRIYDIYGNLIFSEDVEDTIFSRTIDVSSNNSPIFIISVIFTDGSVIQKTALK